MAKTWKLSGDTSGEHYVAKTYVESVIEMPVSTVGVYACRIRTISGKEYYAYFASKAEQEKFIKSWAGDAEELDAEPTPTY